MINQQLRQYDRIILGIDPGTAVMGYGVLGVRGRRPEMIAMGVIRMSRMQSTYLRLRHIYDRILGLVTEYLPDEMAIEAPFYGKNFQTALVLGRAQGVAMAAALSRDVPIHEYEPSSIKKSITGSGAAAKQQVREMLRRILEIPEASMPPELDATDALGAALCHFYQGAIPTRTGASTNWADFIAHHPDRVKNP